MIDVVVLSKEYLVDFGQKVVREPARASACGGLEKKRDLRSSIERSKECNEQKSSKGMTSCSEGSKCKRKFQDSAKVVRKVKRKEMEVWRDDGPYIKEDIL